MGSWPERTCKANLKFARSFSGFSQASHLIIIFFRKRKGEWVWDKTETGLKHGSHEQNSHVEQSNDD